MPDRLRSRRMPAKRHFEFSEGSSNKFWEVWCVGAELFTRYGKIGSDGQMTVKKLGSPAVAKQQHDKLVGEKTKKGYKEKGGKPNDKAEAAFDPNQPRYVDVPEGVVYLEGVERKKHVFWQARLDKRTLHVTTGEVGTEGKATKKTFKDEWGGRHEMRNQVDAMLKKGFTYVLAGKPPKKAAVAAVNPQLEAQIKKDPSDDALAVYGDWLQEQGDIRGELAALQARPDDKKLAKAAAKLLWEQRAYFYGPLAVWVQEDKESRSDRAVLATWRAGWMDSLSLGAAESYNRTSPAARYAKDLIALVPLVASAKFLRELIITRPLYGDQYEFGAAVTEVIALLPKLPTLRRLTLGEFDSGDSELSWSYMHSLAKLWKPAAGLEYVKIRAGSMTLGTIALPNAREFRVETGGLDRASCKAIATASWPKLETLSVWFGKDDYGCNCSIKDVQPILDAKGLGRLKHLGLKNSQFGADIAAAIPKSKIVRQLETLDLSMSHITTETIEKLLAHKDAFAKLKHLDLSRCLLDDKGQKLAKQLAKTVNLEHQRDRSYYADDPEYRYAAVGE